MNILVIHGSMRKGNTYSLVKEIMGRLSAKHDITINEISVADLQLPFCRSCHLCLMKGEEYCPEYGVMRSIQQALLDCDGLIVSGVTYMWSLNAAMKNLLDHLAYGFHRPALFGKKGMVVATSTGTGEKSVAKYLKSVLGQWGVNKAIIVTRTEKEQKLMSPAQLSKKLDRTVERFYRQLTDKQNLTPSIKSIAVHNAFRAMSLSAYSESERDTLYWQQDEMNNVYPIRVGALQYLVGATVFAASKHMTNLIDRFYLNRKTHTNPNDKEAETANEDHG